MKKKQVCQFKIFGKAYEDRFMGDEDLLPEQIPEGAISKVIDMANEEFLDCRKGVEITKTKETVEKIKAAFSWVSKLDKTEFFNLTFSVNDFARTENELGLWTKTSSCRKEKGLEKI